VTAHRLLAPRWLATGGAVVLAGVVGIALLLQSGGSACAAPPSTTAKSGKATFYDLGGGLGNCSFPSAPADDLFVALGASEYSGAAACGSYLDVTGPKGKVRVKVIDSCPPCGPGHIDLSRTAFKKVANEVDGIVKVTYRTVSGAVAGDPISVRVKEGSSRFWLAVLIDNHANRLTKVTVGGRTAKRADFNYWIIDGGAGPGPFKIKITDLDGNTRTVSGIELTPGKTQKSSVRAAGGGAQPAPKKSPVKKPSPSPSVTVSAAASASAGPEPTEIADVPPLEEPPVALAADGSDSC
jgi:expansin